ncbi:hypothetical protein [Nocardia jejuensis]|uniref:hypothetical protein n=1 Tax=Nocardia jejuensis TaxID=328049 RepID=UPI00082B6842|nr:hypothetical protein [Nocardia jejuensis]
MIDLGPGIAVLRAEIDAFYAGFGNPPALRDAFDAAVLLVPLAPGSRIMTSSYGGVDWICTFTRVEEYAHWLSERGELDPQREYPYRTVSGSRLSEYAAGCAEPTGVTVDITGAAPMAFPPNVTDEQISQEQGV